MFCFKPGSGLLIVFAVFILILQPISAEPQDLSLQTMQQSIEIQLQSILAGRDRRRSDTAIVFMEEARQNWSDRGNLQRVETLLSNLAVQMQDTAGVALFPVEEWLQLDDDLPLDSLLEVCQQSLRRMKKSGSVQIGGFVVKRSALVQAQKMMIDLLQQKHTREKFAAEVYRRFQLHRSRGNYGSGRVLFTGYAHPVLPGSLTRTDEFRFPVYRLPSGTLSTSSCSRIMAGALAGKELEIGWLRDPLDGFFLEVQGSGALDLGDGRYLHLQYAGQNGHRYVSLGKLLVAEKRIAPWNLSIPAIRQYFADHPGELDHYLKRNPSAVFFKGNVSRKKPGAPGLVPERSLACDRRIYPQGSLLFVSYQQPDEEDRIHQRQHFALSCDTGGAIKGPGHVDIYLGASTLAWSLAGRQRHPGMIYLLLPRGTILKRVNAQRNL